MDKKTENDHIRVNEILNVLYRNQLRGIEIDKYLKAVYKASSRDIKILKSILYTEGLASRRSFILGIYYVITTKGIQVYESGGYLVYRKRKKQKKQEEKDKERLENEKLQLDILVAKRKIKLFWPITITAFITSIIAIIECILLLISK